MRRAFYDQVDCFRVRRDPTGIPTDPPESLLNMATYGDRLPFNFAGRGLQSHQSMDPKLCRKSPSDWPRAAYWKHPGTEKWEGALYAEGARCIFPAAREIKTEIRE